MLKVFVEKARPGMKLALPVCHPRLAKQVLLRVGYALDEISIGRLHELGVAHVWVRYPALDYVQRYIDSEVMERQGQLVGQITQTFENCQNEAVARLPYDLYRRTLGQLIRDLVGQPRAAVFMGDLMLGRLTGTRAKKEDGEADPRQQDLMRHSSTVTYLCMLMGLKLAGYLVRQRKRVDPVRAQEISNLGLGAMLHDIGVTRLPDAVRDHYEATGDDADPVWRTHPLVGFELVRQHIEPTASTCVLHHHQRYDGNGYSGDPNLVLHGDRIHVFARIIGLAEQFDRLRFPTNAPPRPVVEALGQLIHPSNKPMFDPEVMRALFAVAPPYPPGSIVRLSDDRHAVVLDHRIMDPCRPRVQIIPDPQELHEDDQPQSEPIDLSTEHWHLHVVECDHQDVAALNFDPPGFLATCSWDYAA